MDKRVYVAACDGYDFDTLKQQVDTIFDTLDLSSLIKPGMNVVMKPNLIMKSKPDTAIITHPQVAAAVGCKIQELGGRVTIAESGGGPYTSGLLKSSYALCGYEEIAKKHGFHLNTDCGYQPVEAPNGLRSRLFNIIDPIREADLIVDLAKLKSHCMTGLSGAVKNMFGSVPGLMKPELHCRFPDKTDFGTMLVDLCELVRPKIVFVDAVTAMEGNGPTGGRPRQVGALLAGTDPYCVDLISCHIMHMDPKTICMMQSAMERGLCPESLSELTVLGEDPDKFVVEDYLQPESRSTDFLTRVPKIFRPIATKITTPKPKIRTKDCVGCGKCAESCPQHTIEIKNRKAQIHYNKCIKCYCCHEMCPMKAVDIQRFSLFSL